MCVVLKPPNWEVDAKGQQSASGLFLSDFMMREQLPSAILGSKEFEHGFVHRLDVPSSGLILVGASFEGYALLQFWMHTYSISREYMVLLHGAAPASLQIMDAAINFCQRTQRRG